MYEMMCGRLPFYSRDHEVLFELILTVRNRRCEYLCVFVSVINSEKVFFCKNVDAGGCKVPTTFVRSSQVGVGGITGEEPQETVSTGQSLGLSKDES